MGLLLEHGDTRAVEYAGGLEEWTARGGPLEGASVEARTRRPGDTAGRRRAGVAGIGVMGRVVARLETTSTRGLFHLALWIVLGCAALFTLLGQVPGHGLVRGGEAMDAGPLDALYFSFVTATTLGYGDVTPMGLSRALAVFEAVAGLLLFGAVISKFLSRRQEEVVEELHHLVFEERLSRVQTGLHLVVRELAELGDACQLPAADPARLAPRLESTVLVLLSQLRAVHDLFYRPQQEPDESVLESMLAGLDSALTELSGLLACETGRHARPASLERHLRTTVTLAERICGDCVPQRYAAHLSARMDRVQAHGRSLLAARTDGPSA